MLGVAGGKAGHGRTEAGLRVWGMGMLPCRAACTTRTHSKPSTATRAASVRGIGGRQQVGSPTAGASPACTAFCCFSSLEKNFCAWLRICTAVFVLTWPAGWAWGGEMRRGQEGARGGAQQRGHGARAVCKRAACTRLAPRPGPQPSTHSQSCATGGRGGVAPPQSAHAPRPSTAPAA